MEYIQVKGIIWEDMVNYKKISTTLMMPTCDFKCDKENGVQLCQNWELAATPSITVPVESFVRSYLNNNITEAIVFQGLEPLDSLIDVCTVCACLSDFKCKDDIVIYTGYNKDEISSNDINLLKSCVYGQLRIKWGRYRPNQESHYDDILGVNLASDNQYGELIKHEYGNIRI